MLCDLVETGQVFLGFTIKRVWLLCSVFQSVILIIQEVCQQYWPNTGMVKIREYTLDLLGEEKREGFISRTLSICHKTVLLIYTSVKSIKNEVGCRDDTVPKTVDTRRQFGIY